MAKKWYIGCSGFYYKEWKEVFYPVHLVQSKWFNHYCDHFNTLELNATFYRFPELKTLQGWYKKSPPEFLFAVKVPRTITHIKQFKETQSLLNQFYSVLSNGLEEKLGPVLFQLPPRYSYTEERLAAIIHHLDPTYNNVVEFRNESWWRKDVMESLGKENITFCSVSYPGLNDAVVCNTAEVYYRFHGVPKLFYSMYDNNFLENKVADIKHAAINTAYLYFNNTASAAALTNAAYVQQLVKRH